MKKFTEILTWLIPTLLILVIILVLTGCAPVQPYNGRQASGGLIGGIAGGLICSDVGKGRGNTAAVALCAVAGAMIGQEIGRYMDEADRRNTGAALEGARTGQSYKWTNPDTNTSYDVKPTKTYPLQSTGQPCREFHVHQAHIGGRTQQIWGYACRQADGTWRLVDSKPL